MARYDPYMKSILDLDSLAPHLREIFEAEIKANGLASIREGQPTVSKKSKSLAWEVRRLKLKKRLGFL